MLLLLGLACAEPAPTPAATAAAVVRDVTAVPATTGVVERQPTPPPAQDPASAPAPAPPPRPAPTSAPSLSLTPASTPAAVKPPPEVHGIYLPEPPERDLLDLTRRLKAVSDSPFPSIVNPEPVSYQAGHEETFWVSDPVNVTAYTIQATLAVVSEHAYWYVDDDVDLDVDDMRVAAGAFESEIRPLVVKFFGDIRTPGIDNDPHLTILHTPLRGIAGYYGSQDEYPRSTHPQSNEREMIYMDGVALDPGSRVYLGVLTHEFQHAVHWNQDPGEDSWVNEGLSEVAKRLAGYGTDFVDSFLARPDTQLTYWPDDLPTTPPHYGAASLFLDYMAQHYGGYEGLMELVSDPADGANGVETYLSAYGVTFVEVFEDWLVANYLDASEGPYGYPDRDVRVRRVDLTFEFGEQKGTLPQFGARYIDLRLNAEKAVIDFQGESTTALVGTECYSGRYCWWGGRGDSIDSTLTREFDLSGLTTATLEFWTWYSLEEDWDYAYVEASVDDGETWTILEGQYTVSENPVGNNFGHGYTGKSDDWVAESIDLTPYAGHKVLVRFEYVTDDAVYVDGILIDDLAVRELGFADDVEQERGWRAEGFVRTNLVVPQTYSVQVIEEDTDGLARVRRVELDEQRKGQIVIEGLGSRLEHAVVIVSPVTRGTHQPADYTLTVSPVLVD